MSTTTPPRPHPSGRVHPRPTGSRVVTEAERKGSPEGPLLAVVRRERLGLRAQGMARTSSGSGSRPSRPSSPADRDGGVLPPVGFASLAGKRGSAPTMIPHPVLVRGPRGAPRRRCPIPPRRLEIILVALATLAMATAAARLGWGRATG